jgi:hypothetical protein
VPLKRLCDLALIARRPVRLAAAVPRTTGPDPEPLDLEHRSAAPSLTPAVPEQLGAVTARATVPAVERFYTKVALNRERSTEGWSVSTLTKEKRSQMVLPRTDSALARARPVSRRCVAGFGRGAVFCQEKTARSPRSSTFDWCGRPTSSNDLRRYQD